MIKAQIYTQSDKDQDYTSLIVAKGGTIYFKDVLNTPELTAVQRGVSFIKHQLNVDATEIYPDKLDINDVLKDAYIRYCNINPVEGKEPNDKMVKMCSTQLQIHNRWLCRIINQKEK